MRVTKVVICSTLHLSKGELGKSSENMSMSVKILLITNCRNQCSLLITSQSQKIHLFPDINILLNAFLIFSLEAFQKFLSFRLFPIFLQLILYIITIQENLENCIKITLISTEYGVISFPTFLTYPSRKFSKFSFANSNWKKRLVRRNIC